MTIEKNFVSAVAYMHNDQQFIEDFVRSLHVTLSENFEHFEIILVDDDSTDNTKAKARLACSGHYDTSVTILSMSRFHGLEQAMRAGVDLAIGDFVFEFDTIPYPLDTKMIMDLYLKALDGYDVVSAIPPKAASKLSSRAFYGLFNKTARLENDLHTESFRIISRRAINRITGSTKVIPYRKAAYANCGLPIAKIDIPIRDTAGSIRSHSESRSRFDLAANAILLFTHVGYRTALLFSGIMMAFTVAIAVYSLVVHLSGGAIAGWTTTILFLSFAFFCLFGVLAIVVKYLQILVDLNFQKKNYSFKSIERL